MLGHFLADEWWLWLLISPFSQNNRSFLQKLRDECCKYEHIFYCEQPVGLLQRGVGGREVALLTHPANFLAVVTARVNLILAWPDYPEIKAQFQETHQAC